MLPLLCLLGLVHAFQSDDDSDTLNRPRYPAVTGDLFASFVPSPSCSNYDIQLLEEVEWGSFGEYDEGTGPKDFYPSWIGSHPTRLHSQEKAKNFKKAMYTLYRRAKMDCGESLVRWTFRGDGVELSTTTPLKLLADPSVRTKRSVEVFTLEGYSSDKEGALELESLSYSRVSPESIRMKQKGSLERRAGLTSPYVVVSTEPTLHHHYLKPLSNGWMTTPIQIQEEKAAREELRKSRHIHFPQSILGPLLDGLARTAQEHNLVSLGEEGVFWTKVDGILRQRIPPKAEGSAQQEPEGIIAYIKKNWMYILIGWMVISMVFGGDEPQAGEQQGAAVESKKNQ